MMLNTKSVYIYGAGGFAKRLTQAFQSKGISVRAYLTQKGDFSVNLGSTFAVDSIKPTSDDVVIIGVYNPDTDCRLLFQKLQEIGFNNIYYPWDCVSYLGIHPENYWMNSFELNVNNFPKKCAKVEALLSDEKSIQLFRSIINFHTTKNIKHMPDPSLGDQYHPSDLFINKTISCLIDVGAYTGDTLQDLTSAGFNIKQAITFEPDTKNRDALRRNVELLGIPVINLPFALGRKSAQFQLAENGSGSSLTTSASLSQQGNVIQSVPLDEILSGLPVDYIKIDVEGFEASALMGMKNVLRRCQPRLAISLYHKPLDLIHLPLLLNAIVPNMKMAIRQHRYNLLDTVLYWNYH